MLSDGSGFDLCEKIRLSSETPVILLTARVEEIDRLQGFKSGADDYICKPFSPSELVARVNAVLKRTKPMQQQNRLSAADITIDVDAHVAYLNDTQIEMTYNEFALLKVFVSYPEKVFTRQELLNVTQGKSIEGYERNIDTHIKNIRKKLKAVDPSNSNIRSVYGVGYKLL
ncbi:MAG: response regulator transcription factor [Deltaproteobacteria bacterium]|nr:response regulator transcription factor [Deltaproteobacteria bacterium]